MPPRRGEFELGAARVGHATIRDILSLKIMHLAVAKG